MHTRADAERRRKFLMTEVAGAASSARALAEPARRIPISLGSVRVDLLTSDPGLEARLRGYFARYLATGAPRAELRLEPRGAGGAFPGLWEDEEAEFLIQGDAVVQRDFAATRLVQEGAIDRAYALVNGGLDDSFQNLLRWFMPRVLLAHGAFLLHGGAVIRDGEGYVFFGQSGAGKTTSTSLVAASDPSVYLLGDDAVIIRMDENGVSRLCSAPLGCGYSRMAPEPRDVPIAGLFNLRQSGDNRIGSLSATEGMAALLASAMHASPTDETAELEPRFDLALRFARAGAGIDALFFRPDPSFWPMILAEKSGQESADRRTHVE